MSGQVFLQKGIRRSCFANEKFRNNKTFCIKKTTTGEKQTFDKLYKYDQVFCLATDGRERFKKPFNGIVFYEVTVLIFPEKSPVADHIFDMTADFESVAVQSMNSTGETLQ